ncbi:MAG TPA: phytanoyl-CoA dioxygenase family protein [Candidatus Polarisedimenticolaceae bacterium]|nr:phytanoyl-CoA dioxygenase family protein [Candidatus Polarisedimenticolaceae bacterium]
MLSPLRPREVEEFFEVGYVLCPGVFDPPEVEELRGAFGRLERAARSLAETGMYRGAQFVVERAAEPTAPLRIHRVVWCGAAEPVLERYGRDPRLLAMAGQLLGSGEMNQLINQAHFKLPGDGVEFPWHQDSTHRRYGTEWVDLNGRGSYVQTVTALDDVDADNGPLRLIPGSCKRGHLTPHEATSGALVLNPADEANAVSATMRAGDVLMFGPYTIHGSGPNLSNRPRRSFLNGFAYPGANSRVYPGEGAGRLVRIPA